jgi:hypothetical protein
MHMYTVWSSTGNGVGLGLRIYLQVCGVYNMHSIYVALVTYMLLT